MVKREERTASEGRPYKALCVSSCVRPVGSGCRPKGAALRRQGKLT